MINLVQCQRWINIFLPPAYVVRQEGNASVWSVRGGGVLYWSLVPGPFLGGGGYHSPILGGSTLVPDPLPPLRLGYPSAGTGVPPPPPRQKSEYLLRGRPYASCCHTGGLSCFNYASIMKLINIKFGIFQLQIKREQNSMK